MCARLKTPADPYQPPGRLESSLLAFTPVLCAGPGEVAWREAPLLRPPALRGWRPDPRADTEDFGDWRPESASALIEKGEH